ncbi:PKD-like family lipoprotein [Chitinophaga flava]|uniref:PKD-like family protein n=1 Tax=Chitinophaga flava TaxID=2259036 RepID=A0A365XS50_9BACT|nr:PKD-like family lipoprotein [Chitinophaga flava]RBL88948.1 hypothetical protein DF182_20600 [Chitinophaga flava]
MLLKKYILFLWAATMLLLAGCYKDKGNYDYHPINKIYSGIAKDTFVVFQFDTLNINTGIVQTAPDNAGVSYQWLMYANSGGGRYLLDSTANLKRLITMTPAWYTLVFIMKDNKTGVTYDKQLSIKVISATSEGWMVLENKNTYSDISMITPLDSAIYGIYSKANPNVPLSADAHQLYTYSRGFGQQRILALSKTGGKELSTLTFSVLTDIKDWFFVTPASLAPQIYYVFSTDERLISNGKPYGISTVMPSPYKLALPPAGNYYMAPYNLSSILGPVFYDTIGQRFYIQDPYTYELMDFRKEANAGAFEFNKSTGKSMLFAGAGVADNTCCLMQKNNSDSLFVYTFVSAGQQNSFGRDVKPLQTAPGLSTAKARFFSLLLPQLYYAVNNELYLLNLLSGVSRLIYTFPAGADVSKITMRISEPNKLLAGVNNGNAGTVYYFTLDATGEPQGGKYTTRFDGFGKITDLNYKPAR